MAFFDSFTDSIKQKWLQFFQANREWIVLQMTVESVYTPDGGKRPSSYLILGVINALEPKLAQLMFPFAKLNPDADTLIEVLNLHFDPDIALGNRLSPTVEPEIYSGEMAVVKADVSEPAPATNSSDLNVKNKSEASWAAVEDNYGFDDVSLSQDIASDSEVLSSPEVIGDFGHVSFNVNDLTDESDNQGFDSLNLVGKSSFEEIDESDFSGLNLSEETGFDNLVSDVWGDENSLLTGEESLEGLTSEVFDESEMDRLFPNH